MISAKKHRGQLISIATLCTLINVDTFVRKKLKNCFKIVGITS